MNEANAGGSSNGLPWSSVFDPAANVQAFSAIQADGFRAASELVDRFVRIASTAWDHSARVTADEAPQPGRRSDDLFGATGLEPIVTSWWAMADQLLRQPVQRHAESDGETVATAALDLVSARATGQVVLVGAAGCTAASEVWLHNRGPEDMGKVQLRCSVLLGHDGSEVAAHALRLEPDIIPMPARSSRGVAVEVDVGDELAPGCYRGMLLADGYHELWLPIVLTIAPPAT